MKHYAGYLLLALATAAIAPLSRAAAQPTPTLEPNERRLSVIGEGIVRGQPDMAVMTVGVTTEAEAAREALSANNEAMNRLIEALRAAGIDSRDLQTANFLVEPRYSQPPMDYDGREPFEQRIVGYAVRNELTVRIRELEATGEILDQVVTLGANSISGPTFTVADPRELEDAARRAAIRDAERKAELYAEAAEVSLGPIMRIEEAVAQWPQPVPMAAMAREVAADSSVPIEGGELTFRAQVSVSWDLKN